MKIKKIVLKDGGLKGCDVTYAVEETKDGRTTTADYIAKKKHTVHLGMDRLFKDMRIHLLELAEVVNEDTAKPLIDVFIKETEVIGIEFGGGEFKVWGHKETLRQGTGEKYLTLKPPAVDEYDEYPHIESVVALVKSIVEETKVYLSGDAKVTDDEVVIRWIESGKTKGFDREAFESLPEEDRKQMASDILEKMGGVVIMPDEIEKVDESELEEAPNNFVVGNPIVINDPGVESRTNGETSLKVEKTTPSAPSNEILLTKDTEEIIIPAKK